LFLAAGGDSAPARVVRRPLASPAPRSGCQRSCRGCRGLDGVTAL